MQRRQIRLESAVRQGAPATPGHTEPAAAASGAARSGSEGRNSLSSRGSSSVPGRYCRERSGGGSGAAFWPAQGPPTSSCCWASVKVSPAPPPPSPTPLPPGVTPQPRPTPPASLSDSVGPFYVYVEVLATTSSGPSLVVSNVACTPEQRLQPRSEDRLALRDRRHLLGQAGDE